MKKSAHSELHALTQISIDFLHFKWKIKSADRYKCKRSLHKIRFMLKSRTELSACKARFKCFCLFWPAMFVCESQNILSTIQIMRCACTYSHCDQHTSFFLLWSMLVAANQNLDQQALVWLVRFGYTVVLHRAFQASIVFGTDFDRSIFSQKIKYPIRKFRTSTV